MRKKVGNNRDEGIALVNRALIYRKNNWQDTDAREDYKAALALFEKSNFQEREKLGLCLALIKIAELEDRNYTLALQHYENAADIRKTTLGKGPCEILAANSRHLQAHDCAKPCKSRPCF